MPICGIGAPPGDAIPARRRFPIASRGARFPIRYPYYAIPFLDPAASRAACEAAAGCEPAPLSRAPAATRDGSRCAGVQHLHVQIPQGVYRGYVQPFDGLVEQEVLCRKVSYPLPFFRISMLPLLSLSRMGQPPPPMLPFSESALTSPEMVIGKSEWILPNDVLAATA